MEGRPEEVGSIGDPQHGGLARQKVFQGGNRLVESPGKGLLGASPVSIIALSLRLIMPFNTV